MSIFGKWEQGTARIVARRRHGARVVELNRYGWTYDYVADVLPDGGGEEFRAEFTADFGSGEAALIPAVGDETRVRFRGGRKDVKLDGEFLRSQERAKEAVERQEFESAAAAAPGSAVDLEDLARRREELLRQMKERDEAPGGSQPG